MATCSSSSIIKLSLFQIGTGEGFLSLFSFPPYTALLLRESDQVIIMLVLGAYFLS